MGSGSRSALVNESCGDRYGRVRCEACGVVTKRNPIKNYNGYIGMHRFKRYISN